MSNTTLYTMSYVSYNIVGPDTVLANRNVDIVRDIVSLDVRFRKRDILCPDTDLASRNLRYRA